MELAKQKRVTTSPAIARGVSKNGRRSVVVLQPISVTVQLKTRPNGSVEATKVITATRERSVPG